MMPLVRAGGRVGNHAPASDGSLGSGGSMTSARTILKLAPITGLVFVGNCYGTFGGFLERALAPAAFENALTIPYYFLSGVLSALASSQLA